MQSWPLCKLAALGCPPKKAPVLLAEKQNLCFPCKPACSAT